jgi:CheY-like chemotaxis protein
MARICLFHWNAEEAKPLVKVLEAAGHSVEHRGQMASYREVRANPPEAIVIDLSRLPSHGRELAIFFRGSKKTRHVPIVFVGGEAEKVERVKKLLPDAAYTAAARLRGAVKAALAKPVINPVTPKLMMQRWGDRSTAQKLGIGKGARVAVIDPPSDYARAIGALPEGAYLEADPTEDCAMTLWFVHGVAEFHSALPRMRQIAARSRLWIFWRKNKRDGLDGNIIRSGANAVGLVDYKICSVNETWSGMVFTVKRPSPDAAAPARRDRPTRSPKAG